MATAAKTKLVEVAAVKATAKAKVIAISKSKKESNKSQAKQAKPASANRSAKPVKSVKSAAKITYVLDTNVLIDDAQVFTKFAEQNIILPLITTIELDKHKTAKAALGASARQSIRNINALMGQGDLVKGVITENGTNVSVAAWTAAHDKMMLKHKLADSPDNRIIATSLVLQDAGHTVVLKSNDVSLRIVASTMGIVCEEHKEAKRQETDERYMGITACYVSEQQINDFYAQGKMEPLKEWVGLYPNEFLHLVSLENEKHTAIGRFDGTNVVKLAGIKSVAGISPRNLEQTCFLEACMNPEIELVTGLGKAGSGKTLIAIAAAVQQVINDNEYEKIMVVRSPIVVDEEYGAIGFLPGSFLEKIIFSHGATLDALSLCFPSYKNKGPEALLEYLMGMGKLELQVPAYFRGRSLANHIIIVDEAANASRHEIKTIISRASNGTKVILCGDVGQIDHPKLSQEDNALSIVAEAFKEQKCAAHITLLRGERSELADLACDLI